MSFSCVIWQIRLFQCSTAAFKMCIELRVVCRFAEWTRHDWLVEWLYNIFWSVNFNALFRLLLQSVYFCFSLCCYCYHRIYFDWILLLMKSGLGDFKIIIVVDLDISLKVVSYAVPLAHRFTNRFFFCCARLITSDVF